MMQAARKASSNAGDSRKRMMAAIQIKWQQMRPDLRHSPDELREERLAFVSNVLRLRRELTSLRDLSDRQLGRVLDALNDMTVHPRLPNSEVPQKPIATAEIIHLASAGQVHAINKLLNYLDWTAGFQETFIKRRYKRANPVHLRPKEAHSLLRILLNIACTRELKERGVTKVTRAMINLQIPVLKQRLGIDQKPPAHSNQESEPCQEKLISLEESTATSQ